MARASHKQAAAAIKSADRSLAAFNVALDVYVKSVGKGSNVAVRKSAADITYESARRSPVRYGRFRAAWFEALSRLGAPQPTIPATVAHLGKDGIVRVIHTRPDVIAAGRASGSVTIDETDRGTRVVVGNPTRYGPFLEAGGSRQAANGVIRVAVERHRKALLEDIKRINPDGVL